MKSVFFFVHGFHMVVTHSAKATEKMTTQQELSYYFTELIKPSAKSEKKWHFLDKLRYGIAQKFKKKCLQVRRKNQQA